MNNSILQELIEEINHLIEAKKLLERVYLEVGPYGDGKIERETRHKINDYFNFDDSE